MTNVIKIEEITKESALTILSSADETNRIIEQVRQAVSGEVPDLTTGKGRKRIASLAAKVAKSKTTLDGFGKELVKPIKEQAKAIDANRKLLRDELDALKTEVRQPLTDFENAERERMENHNAAIQYINDLCVLTNEYGQRFDSDYLKASLEEAEQVICTEEHCQEFAPDYAKAKANAIGILKTAIIEVEKAEAEAKELEELRQLKAQKEREEYEAKLKAEAAERAEREAAEAKKQAELAEQRRIEAERQAEIDRIKAQEQAKLDAERAAEQARVAEIERQKREEAQLKVEQEAREANKAHCRKVNTDAKNALQALGLDNMVAKSVIEAIAKGMIPNVTINY